MTHSRKLSATLGLATLATFGLPASSHAGLTPISLTGYNLAGIANGSPVSPSDTASIGAALTASTGPSTVNSGSLDSQYVYFAQGFDSSMTTAGLPVGSSFASLATNTLGTTVTFAIMPASTTTPTPNVLDVYAASTSGTLSLSTPGKYSALSFLENGYNGAQTVTYTLNYTTGTAGTGTFSALDNFSGANPAYYANGRIGVSASGTGGFYHIISGVSTTTVGSNPRLYEIDVTNIDPTRTLSSITFTDTALSSTTNGSGFGIFGISGLAAAPEPSQYAGLLLGGLGMVGLIARKRRVNA